MYTIVEGKYNNAEYIAKAIDSLWKGYVKSISHSFCLSNISTVVQEGRITISAEKNGITLSLDYNSAQQRKTGEMGISAFWPSFKEAREQFLSVYESHWGEKVEECQEFKAPTQLQLKIAKLKEKKRG